MLDAILPSNGCQDNLYQGWRPTSKHGREWKSDFLSAKAMEGSSCSNSRKEQATRERSLISWVDQFYSGPLSGAHRWGRRLRRSDTACHMQSRKATQYARTNKVGNLQRWLWPKDSPWHELACTPCNRRVISRPVQDGFVIPGGSGACSALAHVEIGSSQQSEKSFCFCSCR